jgi:hypothetical protein
VPLQLRVQRVLQVLGDLLVGGIERPGLDQHHLVIGLLGESRRGGPSTAAGADDDGAGFYTHCQELLSASDTFKEKPV